MTKPISARQIWAESNFFRTTIISSLLDMLDQKKSEDVSQYLQHGDPINQTDNERLYNIATGKAADLYTEEILLAMNVKKRIKRLSKCIEPGRLKKRTVK